MKIIKKVYCKFFLFILADVYINMIKMMLEFNFEERITSIDLLENLLSKKLH